MKNIMALAAALAALAVTAWAQAETPDEARVHKLVEPRMGSNVKVDAVSKTGYGGLYEIRAGADIWYTDASARYMGGGKIVDLTTLQDLTRARADELARGASAATSVSAAPPPLPLSSCTAIVPPPSATAASAATR